MTVVREKSEASRPRPRSPWARKRRRLLTVLAVLSALLIPALVWRAGVSRETRALLQAQEAAGRPVTLAQLNAQYLPPGATENAALLYKEALALYRDVPSDRLNALPYVGMEMPEPEVELGPAMREATAAWLALNEGTLEKMRAASALKSSRYLSLYAPAGYNDLSTIGQLPILADLACAAAVYHADQNDSGRTDAALIDALALARSVGGDGLFFTLRQQWEMEEQVLGALQFAWSRIDVLEGTLNAFAAYFTPERRRDQIAHMATVEQCLFLARIREGHRRGMPRNILIATGVGDMNAQVHMQLMGAILEWADAPLALQPAIEERFRAGMEAAEKRALLFLTVKVSRPPGYWDYYRKALDQAALARVGLALYRYRGSHGRFPETLGELAPEIAQSSLVFPSNGQPIRYTKDSALATLSNGSKPDQGGTAPVSFRVGVPPPIAP